MNDFLKLFQLLVGMGMDVTLHSSPQDEELLIYSAGKTYRLHYNNGQYFIEEK